MTEIGVRRIEGLEEDTQALLLRVEEEFVDLASADPLHDEDLVRGFARAFHFRTPAAYYSKRDVEALARELHEALGLVNGRVEGEIRVRLTSSADCADRFLQVTMDDQPFVLASVLETLRGLGVAVKSYLHPILQLDRDREGRVTSARPRTAPGRHDSLLHIRLGGKIDQQRAAEIESETRATLLEVSKAVADYAKMRERSTEVADELDAAPAGAGFDHESIEEAAHLLRWLPLDNFVFLGYRAYRFTRDGEEDFVEPVEGSALGIFRDDGVTELEGRASIDSLAVEVRRRLQARVLPFVSKTRRLSRVHRRTPMDSIAIKVLSGDGEVIGEHRFVGLFTANALNQVCSEIPVLRRKLTNVLREAQVLEGSHEYQQIISTFNSTPKIELFSTADTQIAKNIRDVLALQSDNELRVFCSPDVLGHRFGVLVVLPRERFNAGVRLRIQDALSEQLGCQATEYQLALSEEAFVRLHFYYENPASEVTPPTRLELESAVADTIRTWDDDFADLLFAEYGEIAGAELSRRYGAALSSSYRASVTPRLAVADVADFERLVQDGDVTIEIVDDDTPDTTNIRLFRAGEKFLLSDIMPVLSNLGLLVVDESTFKVESAEISPRHLHAIRVRKKTGGPIPRDRWPGLRQAALDVLSNRYENDVLGGLVVAAELSIRQVELLRTYVHYFHQIGSPHDKESIASALSSHPEVTRELVNYFETKFDPALSLPARERLQRPLREISQSIGDKLEEVSDINQDRIFRALTSLVVATTRTSYFQRSGQLDRLSIKLDGTSIPGLPLPVPRFEIFVHNSSTEGVHLRSGPVARGGIRWSDRRDDYRTEILGLVRAQVTKNAIIVPVGSKGGFVLKRPPESRDELAREVEQQYRTYISGLLDLTDNRDGDIVSHPADCVVYDDPDPYLVVAADKGTASFSDTGNEIARSFGYWLDDAFASGGSNGYDHKKYGITARGAWESIRWHFLELGLDIFKDTFTAVGIGDMSGDVFGNGLLVTSKVKLLAAFDHRHIFLDPNPDPEASFAERKRLFELPRSSWADYDSKVLGPGGGVFSRQSKRITLSPEVRDLLGTKATSVGAEDLIQHILRLSADLLYNGGIGTYVKASTESHADARDEKNNGVRVNANELRCRVVGEGGNLGLTPAARVEFAVNGGRINTDFIDNSGGVDLSDHEVNLKIALDRAVREAALSMDERNALLRRVAPPVCELVLETNRSQARVLSLEEIDSKRDITDHLTLLDELQSSGILDKNLDRFPDGSDLARRRDLGIGLVRPELATLLAFSKIAVFRELADVNLLEDPGFSKYFLTYFPQDVIAACGDALDAHPLKREIAATVLTNEIAHRAGMGFVSRLVREDGAEVGAAVRAYRVADALFGGDELFGEIDGLVDAAKLSPAARAVVIDRYRDAMFDAASGLVRHWPTDTQKKPLGVAAAIDALRPLAEGASAWLDLSPLSHARAAVQASIEEMVLKGVPSYIASRVAHLELRREVPRLVSIARDGKGRLEIAATIYFMLQETLGMARVHAALARLPVTTANDRSAYRAVRQELRSLVFGVTGKLTAGCPDVNTASEVVGNFVYDRWMTVQSFLQTFESTDFSSGGGLSTFIVLAERLRRLDRDV